MFNNKALRMDPPVSRLVNSITEYSATQGSSGFPKQHWSCMDTAALLLNLKQGTRSLEGYITEYLALSNGSDFPDCILIDFFCDGLNQPLKAKVIQDGPRSSLSNFLDYVLWTVGSAFTVGIAEERNITPNCEITAALEHAHKMAATTTPRHVSAASHEPGQVTAAVKESSQVTAAVKESSQVKSPLRLKSQVKSPLLLRNQVKSPLMLKSQVKSSLMLKSQVKSSHR